jgi:hypothetical protein
MAKKKGQRGRRSSDSMEASRLIRERLLGRKPSDAQTGVCRKCGRSTLPGIFLCDKCDEKK